MSTTTSLTEQNRAVVQSLYAAAIRGDFEEALSYVADEVVIEEPPYLPYGGVYKGKESFVKLAQEIGGYVDLAQLTVQYLIADRDRVAAAMSAPARASEKRIDLIEQSTLENGKVVHLKIFYHDAGNFIEHN